MKQWHVVQKFSSHKHAHLFDFFDTKIPDKGSYEIREYETFVLREKLTTQEIFIFSQLFFHRSASVQLDFDLRNK